MKKNINIYTLSLLLGSFLLVACKEKNSEHTEIVDKYSFFKLINNSGVEVAVVNKVAIFPDSLVLVNGGVYEWAVHSSNVYWPMGGIFVPKIYFNKNIHVVYDDDYMPERNPGYGSSYDKIVIDEYDKYSYTFTPEDYQNALKQQ